MIWLVEIFTRIKFYLVIAAGAVAAIVVGYWRARSDGAAAQKLEQAKAREKLQEKYDAIDAKPVDPVGSYDRLRKLHDRDR